MVDHAQGWQRAQTPLFVLAPSSNAASGDIDFERDETACGKRAGRSNGGCLILETGGEDLGAWPIAATPGSPGARG